MTKKFLAIALAISAVCITGCQPKDTPVGPQDGKSLVITPHEVVLNDAEPTFRLSYTLTPNDPTATITWSSSDTLVATVTNRGFVEAAGYGECYIYASFGDAKDSCHVSVKTYLESVVFNSALIWDVDTTYRLDETGKPEITEYAGYKLYLTMATLYVLSDGLYYNNSGSLDGTETGVILQIDAPMYYASAYANNMKYGITYSIGEWVVNDTAHYTLETKPATINESEYMTQMKGFIAAYNENPESSAGWAPFLRAANEAITGPTLEVIAYDEEDGYYSQNLIIPDALCTDARFYLDTTEFALSQYMTPLRYSKVTFKPFTYSNVLGVSWGLNLSVNEADEVVLNDENVHFDNEITSIYGEVPTGKAEVQRRLIPLKARVISEDPALKANFEQKLNKYNIKVIGRK